MPDGVTGVAQLVVVLLQGRCRLCTPVGSTLSETNVLLVMAFGRSTWLAPVRVLHSLTRLMLTSLP
jgi:hypothetical protein